MSKSRSQQGPTNARVGSVSLDELASGVKAWRESRGWTQAELAQRAGITVSPISKIERRKNPNPESATLEAIAGAFGVGIDGLIRGPQAQRTRNT